MSPKKNLNNVQKFFKIKLGILFLNRELIHIRVIYYLSELKLFLTMYGCDLDKVVTIFNTRWFRSWFLTETRQHVGH